MLRRFVREPLVQFIFMGIAVFAFYSLTEQDASEPASENITVGPGQIAHLKEVFTRSRQRPPTHQELEGLVDSFVKEEVNYREGLKLGLDRDDTIIRRRMQQKVEFLMEPNASELEATDEVLADYLKENHEKFRIPDSYKFQQIFFDPSKRNDPISDATGVRDRLTSDAENTDIDQLGDPTLLPASLELSRIDRIAANFGNEFADALAYAEVGTWAGPIKSTYGVHLVLVDEHVGARDPLLEDVRRAVVRDWQTNKRREIADSRYQQLLDNYDVEIVWPESESSSGSNGNAEQQG
ncbi:MAG: peptidylprolyl isomerase [Pseudomonadota bacterium]